MKERVRMFTVKNKGGQETKEREKRQVRERERESEVDNTYIPEQGRGKLMYMNVRKISSLPRVSQ